jgi:YHS domain-containing protein/thiol-disulfide isomerase/thioredoxin
MRRHWPLLFLLLSTLLAVPALAQQSGVNWQHDLEAAKAVAKQTNRLVLVHFWTTSCGPCMALEQNVFNQPGVAAALESQFVPVKLDADENSATAQWFGITRIPCDVVITADGQIVGKQISPSTPAAYVGDLTKLASKHMSTAGQAFAKASSAAPVQSGLNGAYANLQVSPNTLPIASPTTNAAVASTTPGVPASGLPAAPGAFASGLPATPSAYGSGLPANDPNKDRYALSTPSSVANKPPSVPALPVVATKPAVQPQAVPISPPAMATAPPATAAAPDRVTNPFMTATTSASPLNSPPVVAPAQAAAAGGWGAAPGAAPAVPPVAPPPAAPIMPGAVASTPPSSGAPDLSKLPPGSPPLGFEGYCPVSMRNSWKWVPGDSRWGIVHRGRTYWFAGPSEQQQFWTDPDRYTPALSGMDPVLAVDHQQQVPGKREHSIDYDGLFYMFASEATLQQFTANPQRYAASVRQAMGIPRGRLVR